MATDNKNKARGLGKGLGALVNMTEVGKNERQAVKLVQLDDLAPATGQPRQVFDEDKLNELAQSIAKHGVIQPLIVRKKANGGYEIVAGERRWRASRKAGLKEIPVLVRELTDSDMMQQALIENIQRADLNPIEEAEAFSKLLQTFNMTQEALAVSVGRSRPTIANALRLLELPNSTKNAVTAGTLSAGHAKVLLGLDKKKIDEVANQVIDKQLSVRDTEKLVLKIKQPQGTKKIKLEETAFELAIKQKETEIMRKMECKIKIQGNAKKGKVVLHYGSANELEHIIEELTKT